MNKYLRTVLIAPITSTLRSYPWRVACTIDGKNGMIALDHMRSIGRQRVQGSLGGVGKPVVEQVKSVIRVMLVE